MSKARDIASAIPAPSTVSSAELGYLDGVTSAIQTQIDGKQAINANVSTTELGYLDGVTSAIQTQLDAKTAKATLTTTGDIYYASAANTPARLGIGSSAQVLTVAAGVPSWATASSGGMTLIASGSLSNATLSLTSISGAYNQLTLYMDVTKTGGGDFQVPMRLNTNSGSVYTAIRPNSIRGSFNAGDGHRTSTSFNIHSDNGETGTNIQMILYLPEYTSSSKKIFYGNAVFFDGSTNEIGANSISGVFNDTNAITGIESITNNLDGTYRLYGVK